MRAGRAVDAVRSVVFFGLLYVYLWLVVKPCLIASCGNITNFPVFYRDWAFFCESMSYPGGLLRYVSAFLSQFFHHSWAGALVVTAQAWTICACTGWFFKALAVPGRRLLQFVPALLVLATYTQYAYHFPTTMGALAALLFACVYVTVASAFSSGRARPLREVTILVVLCVVSYTTSAAAFLPFAILCTLYEVLFRRRYGTGIVCLLVAASLPYIAGVLVFGVSIVDAYAEMLPLSWHILGWSSREKMIAAVYAIYLLPIGIALAWGLLRIVVAWLRPSAWAKAHPTRWVTAPTVRWIAGSALLFTVAGVVAFKSLDVEQKGLSEVHYYACHRMWPEVLQAARRSPDTYVVINAVDRALYHTGRLGRDMFLYPQHPDALLLTGQDRVLAYWHKFDTLIDLGLVNLAEKDLTECLETYGEHPLILERLALVNMVKGKTGAARIYLGALRKTLFHHKWASDYLARLDADPTLSNDPEIQRLRAQCLRKDSTAGFYVTEMLLSTLVEQGGGNRMAYEYLMSWYMLNGQLPRFVQNVTKLSEFGYTDVPPLYQEAAVIYAYGTRKPVPLVASPDAQRRIEHFSSIVNKYGRNRDAAFAELARDYAGSYLFYYFYNFARTQK